jgi:hypothetical protein
LSSVEARKKISILAAVVAGIGSLVLVRITLFVLTRPHSILFPEFALLNVDWQFSASLLLGIVVTTACLRATVVTARLLVPIAVVVVLLASSAYMYIFNTPVRDQAIPNLWVK